MATVVLIGTLDTKAAEYAFVRRAVEEQGCADIESDAEPPFLPADQMAIDREAWSLGLDDFQWFHILAITAGAPDVAGLRRQRDYSEIIDTNDPHAPKINDRVQFDDGPPIGIVAVLAHQPAMAASQSLARFPGDAEIAGSPGFDDDPAHIGDAALAAGRYESWIGTGNAATFKKLVRDNPRLHAFGMAPAFEPFGIEIDNAIEGTVARWFVAAHEGFSRNMPACCEISDCGLFWLVQGDSFEPCGLVQSAVAPYDCRCCSNFAAIKWIAGVCASEFGS